MMGHEESDIPLASVMVKSFIFELSIGPVRSARIWNFPSFFHLDNFHDFHI